MSEVPGVVKFIVTESRMLFTVATMESCCLIGIEFFILVQQNKKTLGERLHDHVNVLSTIELYT